MLESAQKFWRRFLSVFNIFSLCVALHLNNLKFSVPKDAFCQVKLLMYFQIAAIIFCWKKKRDPSLTKLNPHKSRISCASFGWNWPIGYRGEAFIIKAVTVFSLCGFYLPLKKCLALHLYKIESRLPKNVLCQVW